jgi:peroxiredoxin family protein
MVGIIVHSGDWDRIYHALSIASNFAAFEKKVIVFLTYWAVQTVVRGEIISKDGDTGVLREGLRTGVLKRLEDVAKLAKEIGDVRIKACITTLKLLGLEEKDLPSWVDEVGGLAEVLSAGEVIFV